MKNRSVTLSLLTATLFAVPAFAQGEPPPGPPAMDPMGSPPRREERIRRFDKNGDGMLDEAEQQAAFEAKRAKGDRPHGPMHGEMLKRFDHDGDGQLNDTEKAEAKKAGEEMRRKWAGHGDRRGPGGPGEMGAPGGPGGKMREEILKRFDRDGDGTLNEAEKEAARKAREEMRGRMQQHHQEILSRFDKDADGKMSETERQEMHEAWQKFIQQQSPLKSAAK